MLSSNPRPGGAHDLLTQTRADRARGRGHLRARGGNRKDPHPRRAYEHAGQRVGHGESTGAGSFRFLIGADGARVGLPRHGGFSASQCARWQVTTIADIPVVKPRINSPAPMPCRSAFRMMGFVSVPAARTGRRARSGSGWNWPALPTRRGLAPIGEKPAGRRRGLGALGRGSFWACPMAMAWASWCKARSKPRMSMWSKSWVDMIETQRGL